MRLDILYSPKRVMVTRPPGEIFEGRSVTLICSCDANPPVVSYTWFKRSGTEDSQIWTGQSYTIEHISVEDSYKYKCRASNRLGSAISESMRLDILYSPKRVMVTTPPGEIFEGRSVTLTCSCDANPPVVSYTWFKRSGTEDSQIWTGQSYTIEHISVEDSYKYKCRASNRLGSAISESMRLDILYSPKRVMVTRPPGEIFEGRSVTLTCSCDANPPVVSYTWFKRSGTEDSQIWTGQSYTIEHISVEDSYKYKCRASNRLGSAISETMRLDILYGPKRVEVFSRPSGGILEGRSVTLTCSSDANPPVVSYTWFKRSGTEDSQIWTGQNYTIEHIRVEDSYKYKCRASNRLGSAISETMRLDILYGPKRVQVSSKPFGGIMEGGSMTLTCSSEANPSVKSYTWFKRSGEEDLQIGTGQNYVIEHISIEDSYKYKCRASNQHGSAFSEYTPLNILYSPKNTSVIVTLTCKAHANPPVMDYTWYKEGEDESEPVAYGQTYSITSITKEDIEPFYCKTRNRIGHDYARPVPVTCIGKGQVAAAGIGGFCGGLATAVLFAILWIRRKKWKTDGRKYWVGKSWRKNKTTSTNEYEVDESSRKKKKKAAIEDDYENVGPDDTYTALNIKTSDDVYEALTTQSSAPYDVTQV
uniref:Ig-like domain-containing protein n=1 Tax=Pygocentrus nattereri TaxID=42514 RepID=A0AAR2KI02_PYGNA